VGAKVKCPQCEQIFRAVPEVQVESPALPSQMPPSEEVPQWVWKLLVGIGISIVLFFGWYFTLRDTWDFDNRATIETLANRASALARTHEYEESFGTYNQLFALVKDRKLPYSEDTVAKARLSFEQAKTNCQEYIKQRQIEEEQSLLTQLLPITKELDANRLRPRKGMEVCETILARVQSLKRPVRTSELKTFSEQIAAKKLTFERAAKLLEDVIIAFAHEKVGYFNVQKVLDIQSGVCRLEGVDKQVGNVIQKESVYKWGGDSNSIRLRQMDLENRGYVSIPGSGGDYGKIECRTRKTDVTCLVRYHFKEGRLRVEIDEYTVDGKLQTLQKERKSDDTDYHYVWQEFSEKDDPALWAKWEPVVDTIYDCIKNGNMSNVRVGVPKDHLRDFDQKYRKVSEYGHNLSRWGLLSLRHETSTNRSYSTGEWKTETTLQLVSYVCLKEHEGEPYSSGGSIETITFRLDEAKSAWVWDNTSSTTWQ
jgi:hypothetical protein